MQPDPDLAVAELRRAVTDLGLCGTLVNDHTLGSYLDEPRYAPFWEALQDLGAPLHIHPNPVPADEWAVLRGFPGLEHGTWSWTHRTGGHALRLVFGGVFDRFPGVRIILGHMGEFLPAQLFRIDIRHRDLDPERQPRLEKLPSEYFGSNEHRDHDVLFSIDYPFESRRRCRSGSANFGGHLTGRRGRRPRRPGRRPAHPAVPDGVVPAGAGVGAGAIWCTSGSAGVAASAGRRLRTYSILRSATPACVRSGSS
jgi:hypothetical protein